ncbi:hypothetical protein V1514DRAFT_327885 [Lipomyces japonicus]|uniref:uncharacterized protein n=1 Tax=Lipomyces japonicus TaxID=56871 RepID=UPI0034D00FC3
MSSSYFDIDDLPGPSNKRSSSREVFIAGNDSGYGPSIVSQEEHISPSPGSSDLFSTNSRSLSHIPDATLQSSGAERLGSTKKLLEFQIQQLHYNENRAALGRAITTVMNMLKELQTINHDWPAQYPPFRRIDGSDFADQFGSRPAPVRRAATDLPVSLSTPDRSSPVLPSSEAPRLVSTDISHDFNVLKLDLKLGAVSPAELVQSLEKSAVASLLDGKIAQALKHLISLRERIEDTSSKVLVTGDLNAGKSTFCNALLRRNVLPEDQQPCTNVFCEVLDAQINNGVEEVHAVPHGQTYNRKDERTYDVFPLSDLERLALSSDTYIILKVYVDDNRPAEESLLKNGVVDIALIDAPGLNMDSMQTTAVFARQEEIDVVVFVVSAENHFTLSAKEFIWNAAHEKAFIFIVVNRFDNIRDKKRCARLILDQVSKLSPKTFEDSQDLVHFVSSNKVLTGHPDDDDGDDDNDDNDGNGDDNAGGSDPDNDIVDFQRLERNLRNFVLEKRALSKLAPAKTYLLNVLGDLQALASYNKEISQVEHDRLSSELSHITPLYEKNLLESVKLSEYIDQNVDGLVNAVYEQVRARIDVVIEEIGLKKYVDYPGILSVYSYAADTRNAMLQSLQQSVIECEELARKKTTTGFNLIQSLGLQQFKGTDYFQEKVFNSSLMFTRKRDLLARGSLRTSIEITDYVDLDQKEKLGGMGMSLTLATVAGTQIFGVPAYVLNGAVQATSIIGFRNLKKWIIPAVGIAAVVGIAYLVTEIPNVVPRKLAKKLKRELDNLDYVHANSDRISSECRKVLRFPSEDFRRAFQQLLDEQAKQKNERAKQIDQVEQATRYFNRLYKESTGQRGLIAKFDLEAAIGTIE